MASSTPSGTSQPTEAPVLARRLSWWRGGFAIGLVVVGGLVVGGVVVVVTGGVVVVVVDDVEVVVVVEDVVEDVVDEVVLVLVDVVVDGFVYVDVDVVVHGVVVVVVGVVEVGGSSPLGLGARHPGRSFGHHAAAHTRPSSEAEASGPAPCSATIVNTAPAVSTPI